MFLGSYTPEGAKLPPLFEPTADPTVVTPDVITLFGSVDAPYTILRIARRAGTCSITPKSCVLDSDCPSGKTCPTTCVGGSAPAGTHCSDDGPCSGGGRCGALFDDFASQATDGGPITLQIVHEGSESSRASAGRRARESAIGPTLAAQVFVETRRKREA